MLRLEPRNAITFTACKRLGYSREPKLIYVTFDSRWLQNDSGVVLFRSFLSWNRNDTKIRLKKFQEGWILFVGSSDFSQDRDIRASVRAPKVKKSHISVYAHRALYFCYTPYKSWVWGSYIGRIIDGGGNICLGWLRYEVRTVHRS